ncbi:hypothetical protein RvY_14398-1 [Ramazzottius varieornatus]|uniref:I/LWEQ domain-containing protein n=1 Tax=Ramazzottius varieornatus TaxID=947166 RepID=A0A1D1VZL6_RAMVA|nr:hypothetical protein RvY_14398-1 [Ramazzottius varieornatus]
MQSSLNQITAASSSAARAIHRKIVPPNPVQAEREDFERNTFVALQKAINTEEVPAKEKHVRTLIIGTFQEKGAHTFWSLVLSRVPVQGNPVVAWKFCYVVHKLFRDGHANVIKDSMRQQPFIQDLGRLWGHLKLGYGPLITRYCELLAVKLDFHRKNPRFPGNLHIGGDELQKIAENDPNNYFQLTVEMFDYMENILELAAAVFGSFDMSRANSMTAVGQSRLVAIIPCILDSCQLYDFIVKMMFKLHTALPQDVLSGHRERFTKQFKLLQHLYHSSSNLQYFKNLIQIPSLPERAPNFLSAVSIKEYVTPVAREQEQPEEVGGDTEGVLIDTTNTNGNNRENETPSTNGYGDSINDQENSLTVKDRVIEELLQEIERLRRATDKIKSDDLVVIDDLRNRVVELEREGEEHRAQTEMERLELMRQIEQSAQNPQVMANFEELDKRAKVADDKFKKLKEVYNELREKHVGLLRDHANTEKQYKATKKALEDTERQNNELNVEVMNFNMEKEQLQRSLEDTSVSVQRQLEEKAEEGALLEKRLAEAESESRSLASENDNVKALLEAVQLREQELTASLDELLKTSKADKEHWNLRIESLTISSQEVLNEKEQELTSLKTSLQDVETELCSVASAKSKLELEHEATLQRVKDLRDTITVQKESFDTERETLRRSMETSAGSAQAALAKSLAEQDSLRKRITSLENELQSVTESRQAFRTDYEAAMKRQNDLREQLAALEGDFESINFQHELETRGLRQSLFNITCGTAAEEIKQTVATWEHPSFTMLTSTPEFLLVCVEPALDHLRHLRSIPVGQEDRMNELSKEILLTFHHISHCLIQCMETSHMAPIDLTDEFSLLAKQIGEESVEYLQGFREDPQGVAALLGGLEEKLEVLQQLSTVLIPKVEDVRSDEVADMVEKELHDMDKAIEEAALKIEEMLVNSRTRDTGVKLEVNAKILDSCTTLMTAIRILVRKSRALQQEIMAAGKGFSSPKEFYKRNHRWTEGLISAAKTVGLGANVLLQAADKVVSGKGKFEELVVASQEVSAGTVQLVVSSKVKAERNSATLAELSKASKSVTQAAGAVVATSKSCAQLVEEKADLDFSSLSLHKIKRIEMDAQVRVLELENSLTKEREKLASIRRQHYALAGTTEGGDGDNSSGVS